MNSDTKSDIVKNTNSLDIHDILKESQIPRDSLAMRLTLDPRNFDQNEKKKLKEKLIILKDAYKQEKKLKEEYKNSLLDSQQKYKNVLLEIDSKDQEAIKQQQEIQKLREILIIERNSKEKFKSMAAQNGQTEGGSDEKNNQAGSFFNSFTSSQTSAATALSNSNININNSTQNSIFSNVGSIFGFGIQAQYQLQQGAKDLQIKDLTEKLEKLHFLSEQLKDKLNDSQQNLASQAVNSENKLKDLKQKIQKQDEEYENLQKLNKQQEQIIENKDKQNAKLIYSQQETQQEIQHQNSKILKLESQESELNHEIKQFGDKYKDLLIQYNDITSDLEKANAKIQEQDKQIIQQQQDLGQMKQQQSQIQNSGSSISQQFNKKWIFLELNKLNGLSTYPVQLIFRIDLEGKYLMELHSSQQSLQQIQCSDIMDIEISQNPPTLSISYRSEERKRITHNYQCPEELVQISQRIKDFVYSAPKNVSSNIKKQQYNSPQQSVQGNNNSSNSSNNNNNFMSGMFSMFKNQ